MFDKEQNGSISSAELRHLLTNLGERLTDEEVEQLLSGFEDKNGLINYEEWIRKLLRKLKRTKLKLQKHIPMISIFFIIHLWCFFSSCFY